MLLARADGDRVMRFLLRCTRPFVSTNSMSTRRATNVELAEVKRT
jgi:hypothetical protein